jgi:hypothetical protein
MCRRDERRSFDAILALRRPVISAVERCDRLAMWPAALEVARWLASGLMNVKSSRNNSTTVLSYTGN